MISLKLDPGFENRKLFQYSGTPKKWIWLADIVLILIVAISSALWLKHGMFYFHKMCIFNDDLKIVLPFLDFVYCDKKKIVNVWIKPKAIHFKLTRLLGMQCSKVYRFHAWNIMYTTYQLLALGMCSCHAI